MTLLADKSIIHCQKPSMPPVQNLVGNVLWGAAAGNGTGSLVTLHFGAKLRRRRSLDNPNISEILRTHEGEFVLFVKCGWQIDCEGAKIADNESSNRPEGEMSEALRRLLRRAVKRVTFAKNDVSVDFSGNLSIHLYPKVRRGGFGNYSFSTAEQRYMVGDDLQVDVRNRR